MRRWKTPGLSLAVVQRGRPLTSQGFGFRDREGRLPATPRTVYGIASVTKSFTALAILRLEEEGALSTSDPVVRHLPEFGTPDGRWTRRITLHHFLTHSSGLPPLPSIYYTSIRSFGRDPPYDRRVARRVGVDPDHAPIDTYEGILEYLRTARYRLLGPPGAQFSYSNEAFGLLGAVVERASGRTFESYLEESVLRPLGMRSTTFDTGIMRRSAEVTTPYSPKRTGGRHGFIPASDWWEDTCLRAAGGLRTNVEDMARYVEMFLNRGRIGRERVFRPRSIERVLTPHVAIYPGLGYGYGVAIRPNYHGTTVAFHEGGLPGVSSIFAIAPQKGLGAVVLANAEQVPSRQVLRAALNERLGLPLTTPLQDIPPIRRSHTPLSGYTGWYCSGEGIWVQVTPSRNALRADFRGIELTARGLRLEPAGQDRFVLLGLGPRAEVRFERTAHGRVWALFLGWRLLRRREPRELPRARTGGILW
jgi:CubicO group peptidase (beta-lactamase class C family)